MCIYVYMCVNTYNINLQRITKFCLAIAYKSFFIMLKES